jgi:uncharacterized lipoprotein YehR (DUF1307 family)
MYKKYVVLIGVLLLIFSLCSCDEYISPGINDFSCKLSGDYTLYHAHESHVTKNTKENSTKYIIDNNVIGIAWNDNFILAEQSKDEILYYWIIDVKTDKIYGPLTENDFRSQKKDLNVSDELKLEDPNKYRYLDQSSAE